MIDFKMKILMFINMVVTTFVLVTCLQIQNSKPQIKYSDCLSRDSIAGIRSSAVDDGLKWSSPDIKMKMYRVEIFGEWEYAKINNLIDLLRCLREYKTGQGAE